MIISYCRDMKFDESVMVCHVNYTNRIEKPAPNYQAHLIFERTTNETSNILFTYKL